MKITIPEIPPSLNKYAGRMNGWEYRAEKQRWIGLMRAYCKKQKPMDKAIVTITYYFPTRHRHDPDNYNGKMLMDGLTDRGVIADDSAQRNMVEVTCKYCGKKFFGHEAAKFCSKVCYQKAVSEGKYNKVENRIKRKPGKIDIEIRICGKTNDRMENVDYYEAREIWRKGWLGRGYAALVTVDGKLLDTIPKVTKFFGFRGEGY